ncbi:Hexosyltransferase [Meloidogyne graminicola]|uniref:Hexosyltransferase n=1 Tax=Meloidogyne graminicola TaxID=189291 RepID=A0A8S9ZIB0_9BILA|nr:Hexosyltransferase [Meloidogyne graminicola]
MKDLGYNVERRKYFFIINTSHQSLYRRLSTNLYLYFVLIFFLFQKRLINEKKNTLFSFYCLFIEGENKNIYFYVLNNNLVFDSTDKNWLFFKMLFSLIIRRIFTLILLPPKKSFLVFLFPLLIGLLFGTFLFSLNQKRYSRRFSHFSYFSRQKQQNNNKQLILVGVMTTKNFLETRALQIWQTWAEQISGEVIFFVSENTELNGKIKKSGMPIISLRGVDDSYPPQKKSFAMLRWMFDNRFSDFHWFLRADDDLYIRSEKLANLLLSLDPSKALLLGQAGLGNIEEYGQLSLGPNDNYCMGGPGIILSKETLGQLAPHLEQCLRSLLTTHEDVELGRCIRKHVGIACPWNYEMQTLFHNNASIANLFHNYSSASINSNLLFHLITLHPVKNPISMRFIHLRAKMLKLSELRQKRMEILEQLEKIKLKEQLITEQKQSQIINSASNQNALFSGLIPKIPKFTENVPIWEFISSDTKLLFCVKRPNCPKHTIEVELRRQISQVLTQIFDEFNLNALQKGRILHFQRILYGYIRVQPTFGIDFVLDIALRYRRLRGPLHSRAPLTVRRHVFVQQRFGPIQSRCKQRILAKIDEKQIINIIIALKGRSEVFKSFAKNLINLAKGRGDIRLILVHYSSDNINENILINTTITQLLNNKIPVHLLKMPLGKVFNRGEALTAGISLLPSNSLLLLADVDILIQEGALDRIRLNTILGKQIYFPIVFSEFSPTTWKLNNKDLYSQQRGYFRHFGFGIVSLYRIDFDVIGGFNQTIKGWGLEDVDFFEKVLNSEILPFRAIDPDLIHIFHSIDCNKNNKNQKRHRKDACEGTRAQGIASLDFLAEQFGPNL